MRVETKISGKVVSDSGSLVVGEKGHLQATIEVGPLRSWERWKELLWRNTKVQIRSGGESPADIYHAGPEHRARAYFEGNATYRLIQENRILATNEHESSRIRSRKTVAKQLTRPEIIFVFHSCSFVQKTFHPSVVFPHISSPLS